MATNRQIQIDSNTLVGYNYIKSQYYVTNRSYTTYRTSTEEILKVLESLGIGIQNTRAGSPHFTNIVTF